MLNNIKTEYNFLDSYIKIDELISYAKENNFKYLGICDINTTYANYKFYSKCIKNDIKPVIGLQINYKKQEYLMYAKNAEGIKRINEINTLFNKTASLKFNSLEKDLKLVIAKGDIAQSILQNADDCEIYNKLNQIFCNEVYLGILSNMNNSNDFLKYEKIKKSKIKSIYIDEIKFIKESDVEYYITLKAIKNGNTINTYKKNEYLHHALEYSRNLDEEIVKQTEMFLQDMNPKYPEQKLRPPKYMFSPNNMSAFEHLKALCIRGLNKRLNNQVTNIYKQRLIHELKIINDMQFNDYFLIVWDIVKHAKQNDILVGPGRGSAAGSLVSYCLGITDIDPVKNTLVFERFLNPHRITMPDIDVDFEDRYRNDIVEYVIERFGEKNVCKIGTIVHMQAKMAIRDVAKAYGIKQDSVEILTSEITNFKSFERNLQENIQIKKLSLKDSRISTIIDIILKLEGMPRQSSIHAAGVLMVDTVLDDYCSVNHENVSLCEAKELEEMGLLKMDILSLSNLTFISNIISQINTNGHHFTINDIKEGDPQVYKMLSSGKTFGIFQIESDGMRNTIMRIKPDQISEIADALSLYRPGPKEFINQYIASKAYQPKTKNDLIFANTRGILIYQEQILLLAQQIAGYDLGEADILRRAISKKDYKVIRNLEVEFITRGVKNGYTKQEVIKSFEIIKKFANYGFNKAHAFSYAKIVYQMSYLKVKFPQIFYAELFYYNFNSPKRDLFIAEVKSTGIKFLPPHILYSGEKITIDANNLRLGFSVIDGIGTELIKQIIENRQFIKNANDIVNVVTTLFGKTNATKAQIASLIDAGCFDCFNYNRKTLHNNLINLINPQIASMLSIGSTIDIEQYEEYTLIELAEKEKKAIKFNIKYNLFEDLLNTYKQKYNLNITTLDKIYRSINPGIYVVLVQLKSIKVIKTKKGEQMCFLTVNSESEHDITVFPRVYNRNIDLNNKKNQMLLFKVSVDKENIVLEEQMGVK